MIGKKICFDSLVETKYQEQENDSENKDIDDDNVIEMNLMTKSFQTCDDSLHHKINY